LPKNAKYTWVDGKRVSTEDGSRLLKTPEAAEMLGVPVDFVRELIHRGRLAVKATYVGAGMQKCWLVSEKDVISLRDVPLVIQRRERYSRWLESRRNAQKKTESPLPKAKIRPLKRKRLIMPDPFQVQAVDLALKGADVLVVAPTGAGKTWIAEQLAKEALQNGMRFVYASPLKALSNQKYLDFISLFGEDSAGIITGDVTINPNADAVTMTTEIFRNKCVCSPVDLQNVKWAVVDEFHLLDSDRGSAWEEAVIFAPSEITLVYLSATISNYLEIASWIEWARGKNLETVISKDRPVPLVWRWLVDGKTLTEKTAPEKIRSLQEAKEERYWSRSRYGGWRDWYDEDDYDDDWDEEDW
jgi:ATP-dependent RNA helicase HelY